MKLHEFEAKRVLENSGVPIPEGIVVESPREARDAAEKLGKVAVKAQVHIGGRGKAGGIKIASSPNEAEKAAEEILSKEIKGEKVRKLLIEKALDIDKELYLGVTTDRENGKPVIIASSEGGVDIEETAEERPEAIARNIIDPVYGLQPYQAREAIYQADFPKETVRDASSILSSIYNIWEEKDGEEIEINPLILTKNNGLIAADAVLKIDDSALYRQDLKEFKESTEQTQEGIEGKAAEAGLDYVSLEGNIGIIGNGAGLVMATLDLVDKYGGKPANFLDVGGGAGSESVSKALELVFEDSNVDSVLFNVFGGITRCDEVAEGINNALPEDIPKPMIVRLVGTNEDEGRKILDKRVETTNNFDDAVKKAVNMASKT